MLISVGGVCDVEVKNTYIVNVPGPNLRRHPSHSREAAPSLIGLKSRPVSPVNEQPFI